MDICVWVSKDLRKVDLLVDMGTGLLGDPDFVPLYPPSDFALYLAALYIDGDEHIGPDGWLDLSISNSIMPFLPCLN